MERRDTSVGYKIVEAERRGQKIKKKLDIDAVEAEARELIFWLYLDDDGGTGPLGVKETTKCLNTVLKRQHYRKYIEVVRRYYRIVFERFDCATTFSNTLQIRSIGKSPRPSSEL